jgi:hypothetical protein
VSVVAALVLPAVSVAAIAYVTMMAGLGFPFVAATIRLYPPDPSAVVEYDAVGAGDVFVAVTEVLASAEPEI